jgi:hypothetical protein
MRGEAVATFIIIVMILATFQRQLNHPQDEKHDGPVRDQPK